MGFVCWLFSVFFTLMNFVCLFVQRFFFKSQVVATNKLDIKSKDFVWVTKDELLEYFPEHSEYLTRMIIS